MINKEKKKAIKIVRLKLSFLAKDLQKKKKKRKRKQ